LLFSFLIIGSVMLTELIIRLTEKNRRATAAETWAAFRQNTLSALLAALPVFVLFGAYIFHKGLNPSPRGESDHKIWMELRELTALSTMMNTEKKWAIGVAVLFLLLALGAFVIKLMHRKWRWTDVLLPVFGLTLLIYFKQPGGIAGAGILPIRLQLLPYLMLLLWLASVDFPRWVQAATLGCTAVIFAALMSIRLPHHRMASEAAEEYASAASVIPDKVSVLPISFDHNGRHHSDREVADRIWLFMHAGDYIGAQRRVVMLGNYEAATHNFPLIWRWERNPFDRLPKDGEGFEGQPPNANLLEYPKNSNNATVDYVVTWCMDRKKFGDHRFVQSIQQQLDQGYDLVFTSQNGFAKAYKRKGL
jgi:hypothetical protein